jgi:hypothetical protein
MTFGAGSLSVPRVAIAVLRPKAIVALQLHALLGEFPIPIAPVHDNVGSPTSALPTPIVRYRCVGLRTLWVDFSTVLARDLPTAAAHVRFRS